MIPVLLAVGTSAVLVRLLGVTLSPLTTVSGPLVVATCAEFCILLVARYAEERNRGLDPSESNRVAAERTGRAFFTSALTTLGGFAVLMFSPLPLLADFGLVVTINIAVAVLAALVVVPPLLEEADRRGWLAMGAAEGARRRPVARPRRLDRRARRGGPRPLPRHDYERRRLGGRAAAPDRGRRGTGRPADHDDGAPTTAPASTVPGSTVEAARCRRVRPNGRPASSPVCSGTPSPVPVSMPAWPAARRTI